MSDFPPPPYVLGDGIRRNIASVDPLERTMLRDAFIELNHRFFPGNRNDTPAPGGVTWWFKQDEIHQATHVHHGPEFLPWHREIVNRLEEMLRQINPQLSLHYWDWTQDPRSIPDANLGGGTSGPLNLFKPDFMGYGGVNSLPIDEPWLTAGYYVLGASPDRDDPRGNAADPPRIVDRYIDGFPATAARDYEVLRASDYARMRNLLEMLHDDMHGFVNMGGQHISFRDPFVFLLHSNVDRLFARWQTNPDYPGRLDSNMIYGTESNVNVLNHNVEPWSTGKSMAFGETHFTRPWYRPENQGVPHTYKDPSIVSPPRYDSNFWGMFDVIYVLTDPPKELPDPVTYLTKIKGINEPLSHNKEEALQQLKKLQEQITNLFKTDKLEKSVYEYLGEAISEYTNRLAK